MRRLTLLVALILGAVVALGVSGAASPSGSAKARWVMSDLGTLGGRYSKAVAINERGQVVGKSQIRPGGWYEAFLWQSGKLTDLVRIDPPAALDPTINARG
jgi:probable HAF family extracellular repeat protein